MSSSSSAAHASVYVPAPAQLRMRLPAQKPRILSVWIMLVLCLGSLQSASVMASFCPLHFDQSGLSGAQLAPHEACFWAQAPSGPPQYSDFFDPVNYTPSLWAEWFGSAGLSTVCGNDGATGTAGGNALTFGLAATPGLRGALTKRLSVSAGNNVSLSFSVVLGNGGEGSCENIDSGEEIFVYYRLNDTSSSTADWQLLIKLVPPVSDITCFRNVAFSIPVTTNSTIEFWWRQPFHSGSKFDQWALDSVQIWTEGGSVLCSEQTAGPGSYVVSSGVITACPAAFYCPTAWGKAPCLAGDYCPPGRTSRVSCNPGFYCPNTTHILPCPSGMVCPLASVTPKACSAGFLCPSSLSLASAVVCPAGFYCVNNASYVCPSNAGYYCPAGSKALTRCPPGFLCPTLTSARPCPAGRYCLNNTIDICPQGSFCQGRTGEPVPCSQPEACPTGAAAPGSTSLPEWVFYSSLTSDTNVSSMVFRGAASNNSVLVLAGCSTAFTLLSTPYVWLHSAVNGSELSTTALPYNTSSCNIEVTTTPDGPIFVVGSVDDALSSQQWLHVARLSASGTLVWSMVYPLNSSLVHVSDVSIHTSSSSIIICGHVNASNSTAFVASVSFQGTLLWTRLSASTPSSCLSLNTSHSQLLVAGTDALGVLSERLDPSTGQALLTQTLTTGVSTSSLLWVGEALFLLDSVRTTLRKRYFNSSAPIWTRTFSTAVRDFSYDDAAGRVYVLTSASLSAVQADSGAVLWDLPVSVGGADPQTPRLALDASAATLYVSTEVQNVPPNGSAHNVLMGFLTSCRSKCSLCPPGRLCASHLCPAGLQCQEFPEFGRSLCPADHYCPLGSFAPIECDPACSCDGGNAIEECPGADYIQALVLFLSVLGVGILAMAFLHMGLSYSDRRVKDPWQLWKISLIPILTFWFDHISDIFMVLQFQKENLLWMWTSIFILAVHAIVSAYHSVVHLKPAGPDQPIMNGVIGFISLSIPMLAVQKAGVGFKYHGTHSVSHGLSQQKLVTAYLESIPQLFLQLYAALVKSFLPPLLLFSTVSGVFSLATAYMTFVPKTGSVVSRRLREIVAVLHYIAAVMSKLTTGILFIDLMDPVLVLQPGAQAFIMLILLAVFISWTYLLAFVRREAAPGTVLMQLSVAFSPTFTKTSHNVLYWFIRACETIGMIAGEVTAGDRFLASRGNELTTRYVLFALSGGGLILAICTFPVLQVWKRIAVKRALTLQKSGLHIGGDDDALSSDSELDSDDERAIESPSKRFKKTISHARGFLFAALFFEFCCLLFPWYYLSFVDGDLDCQFQTFYHWHTLLCFKTDYASGGCNLNCDRYTAWRSVYDYPDMESAMDTIGALVGLNFLAIAFSASLVNTLVKEAEKNDRMLPIPMSLKLLLPISLLLTTIILAWAPSMLTAGGKNICENFFTNPALGRPGFCTSFTGQSDYSTDYPPFMYMDSNTESSSFEWGSMSYWFHLVASLCLVAMLTRAYRAHQEVIKGREISAELRLERKLEKNPYYTRLRSTSRLMKCAMFFFISSLLFPWYYLSYEIDGCSVELLYTWQSRLCFAKDAEVGTCPVGTSCSRFTNWRDADLYGDMLRIFDTAGTWLGLTVALLVYTYARVLRPIILQSATIRLSSMRALLLLLLCFASFLGLLVYFALSIPSAVEKTLCAGLTQDTLPLFCTSFTGDDYLGEARILATDPRLFTPPSTDDSSLAEDLMWGSVSYWLVMIGLLLLAMAMFALKGAHSFYVNPERIEEVKEEARKLKDRWKTPTPPVDVYKSNVNVANGLLYFCFFLSVCTTWLPWYYIHHDFSSIDCNWQTFYHWRTLVCFSEEKFSTSVDCSCSSHMSHWRDEGYTNMAMLFDFTGGLIAILLIAQVMQILILYPIRKNAENERRSVYKPLQFSYGILVLLIFILVVFPLAAAPAVNTDICGSNSDFAPFCGTFTGEDRDTELAYEGHSDATNFEWGSGGYWLVLGTTVFHLLATSGLRSAETEFRTNPEAPPKPEDEEEGVVIKDDVSNIKAEIVSAADDPVLEPPASSLMQSSSNASAIELIPVRARTGEGL